MGSGNICVNTKECLNERNQTLQYPSHSKEEEQLFTDNIGECYNSTNPINNVISQNYYNNTNYITINSRKWYNAAPRESISSPFNIKKQTFESEISQQDIKTKTRNININNTNNNKIKEKAEKVEKVEQPPVKNKAGPIIRNKKLKRNQDKEEHNNKMEQQERKKTSNENKKHLTTNYKKDNSNKKKELNEDDNINDYKSYLNKNENKKVKKENETEINDPNIINTLLSQMNSLSEKQLSLIDVMDNIQMETQGQIKDLNKRITKLERNIEELNNELYDLKNDN